MTGRHGTLEERFWRNVRKGRGCWEWTASKHKPNGYGIIAAPGGHPMLKAHRVSWEIHHGPIPPGFHVLHKCDNKGCVRPDHLFLGTHDDNMQDMKRKGRAHGPAMSGDSNGAAKLTDAQAHELLSLKSQGWSNILLAKKFGISRPQVSRIVSGASWKHLKK